jgi:hypothetical protein
MTLLVGTAHAASINLPVEDYPNPLLKHAKHVADATLTGTIEVLNLGGPLIVLETPDHQRVTVYSAPTMDPDLKQQLRDLEAKKAQVRVAGSLINVCSPELYKAQPEKAVCEVFDKSKKVSFEVL